ncbi:hypothetical protein [Helicobacter cinaedi]|uniref:hypothetical protein n=1 Tax=Helicobacter cinaedi TaxID=213 RepID=UPI0012B65938|nr:hypothetical protein [Helicobacter cinaedi]
MQAWVRSFATAREVGSQIYRLLPLKNRSQSCRSPPTTLYKVCTSCDLFSTRFKVVP